MKYKWGIIGAGSIAHEMAEAIDSLGGMVYGVCASRKVNALKFQKNHNVKNVYENADELLSDENIDIVYIATPHSLHYEMIKKSLEKGKHVFCEKAITVNSAQLERCVDIAEKKGLVIMDGMTIFHMPLYKKLKEIVDSQVLGPVKMIQVNFGSLKEYDVNNRFFSKELAGGALLDIGVYAVSFARFFMKENPSKILTTVETFETGVDETSGIILKNDSQEMAVIALTMRAKQPKRGVVACENGYIEVCEYPRAQKATINYFKEGRCEEISSGETSMALEYEVMDMEEYVADRGGKENLQNVRDVMKILTEIRKQWGIEYPSENDI